MASAGPSQASASSSRQGNAPQKSPDKPREGKSKRTLIESACTACQRRKSRCDGQRPACARCKALQTDCEYQAEVGESRWSALRRKNRILERERDDARELVAFMHSSSEPEAQDLYRRIRADTQINDIGALIHQVREGMNAAASSREQQQQQQNQQQYQTPMTFTQAGFNPSGTVPAPQLPPLRSVVNMPSAGGGVLQQPLPQPFPPTQRPAHRQGSMASAVSSASYSSMSSSDGRDQQSLSPREDPSGNWPQNYS